MRSYLPVFLCFICSGLSAGEAGWQLSAEQWARPRSGVSLVEMAPLAEVVEHLNRKQGSRLLVGYPGGEEGSLWAFELRSWLVALGVPSGRIELVSGSRQGDALNLQIQDRVSP